MKLILLFLIVFFSLTNTLDEEDIIVWNSNVNLSWSDFKGNPRDDNRHVAMSKCGIRMEQSAYTLPNGKPTYSFYAFFVPSSSWYISEKVTTKTLSHEQLHFDIAELYARKLRKQFSENEISPDIAERLFKVLYKEYRTTQELYDRETQNGTRQRVQKSWLLKVSSQLAHFKAYSN